MSKPHLKEVNPDNPPAPLDEVAKGEIAGLARRQKRAGGLLMKAVNLVGSSVEDGMKVLPKPVRDQIDKGTQAALMRAYDMAAKTRTAEGRFAAFASFVTGDRAHKALAAFSGAVGGIGGCRRRWRSCRWR